MRFINARYDQFLTKKGDRKIILFGATSMWSYYLRTFSGILSEVLDNTMFIVDNDISKQNTMFEINNRFLPIYNIQRLKDQEDYVILITVSLAYHEKICKQLEGLGIPAYIECYSLQLMTFSIDEINDSCVDNYFSTKTAKKNRPQIHSFWFSGEEKPELYKRCIDSWYKYCPGFTITEWNADNYDVTKNKYMREAFENKKWAFASDYARLDVIYQYGGIYMDMDVELIAPITFLLNSDSFFCRQYDGFLELGSGFGAVAGNKLIGEMLNTYENRSLFLENGEIDKTSQPEWLSGVFRKYGINYCHDSQVINNSVILSNNYITCYTDQSSVKNAKIGIHWHNGSWLDEKDRELIKKSFGIKGELICHFFNETISI